MKSSLSFSRTFKSGCIDDELGDGETDSAGDEEGVAEVVGVGENEEEGDADTVGDGDIEEEGDTVIEDVGDDDTVEVCEEEADVDGDDFSNTVGGGEDVGVEAVEFLIFKVEVTHLVRAKKHLPSRQIASEYT